MMKRFIWVALIGVIVFGTAAGQDTGAMSLDEMIALVVKDNPMVREGQQGINSALAAAEASRSGFYPDAKAELTYARLGPVAQFSLPGGGTFDLYPANNYNAQVTVHQKIFDFNKTSSGAALASSRVPLAEDRLETVKRDLVYATVQSFYTTLFLQRDIAVQDDQINALNQYLSFADTKLRAGTATEFDVLTIRVRIAAARDHKIDLVNRLQKEQNTLRRLANLPGDATVNLKGTFDADPVGMDADSLFAVAQQQRIDLKDASDAVAMAEFQTRVASSTNNLSLIADLAYGVKNGYIPNLDILRGNYVAGLTLKVPLFDGFKQNNLREEADAKLLAARERKNEVAMQIRSDILDALSNLRSSSEKLQNSKLNVEQAQQAVDLAKAKYNAGVITNLDLLDAQTAFELAKLSDVQSLFGFVLSKYGLKRAIGERIW
jgi:outer membrane protein